jgi:hypothetical protein
MKTSDSPRLFLTDYASYNNGTQFQFGHWVDLDDFADEVEFSEYITKHLAECDKKSPLGFGSIREEPMFTDFENFPRELYSESCSPSDLEALFTWINLEDDDKIKVEALMSVHGYDMEYCLDHLDNCHLTEETDNAKYELFEMFYPEAEQIENSNNYVSIDYDRFIRDNYTRVEIEGTTYLLEDQ